MKYSPTLAILLVLAVLPACSQSVDFDVRVSEAFAWHEILSGQLPEDATVVEVPGGVELSFSLGQVIDLDELNEALSGVLQDGGIQLLAASYQVPENSSSHGIPSFRVSIAEGRTDHLEETRLLARLPSIPPGESDVDVPLPWAPDGRESLEHAMQSDEFSYFISGTVFLPEGSPVPTGEVVLDLLVTGRSMINF